MQDRMIAWLPLPELADPYFHEPANKESARTQHAYVLRILFAAPIRKVLPTPPPSQTNAHGAAQHDQTSQQQAIQACARHHVAQTVNMLAHHKSRP
jgi:hypothetical protein